MKIKSFFFYLVLSFLIIDTTSLNAQTEQKRPVFVLVHGAWHGGWCWQKVSSLLRQQGDDVYTPTLSGLGEHENTLSSAIDLNTHIADIVNFIVMEDLHDVVLVGHSYAGAVITGVADRIPERLSRLVYLDAMLLENGQSALSVHPAADQAFLKKAAEKNNNLSVSPFPVQAFGITGPEEVKWVTERLTPQPYQTFTQPLILKHPFGNHLPLSYIACTDAHLPVLKAFADKVRKNKDWKFYTLNTGHDAMLTAPDELVSLLILASK